MGACHIALGAAFLGVYPGEWALTIQLGKAATWALTHEWALARDTTVLHERQKLTVD